MTVTRKNAPGALSEAWMESSREAFRGDDKNRLAMNAVTRSDVTDVAMCRDAFNQINHTFSHTVPVEGKATYQAKTGRCWLFAALNVLRLPLMEEHGLEEFEFSQNFLFFWDKLEKANYFLDSIIETREQPLNGRLVSWLLANAVPDGGQWDMFVNLVEKYGLVPKSAMPESHSSSHSLRMNRLLLHKLREYGKTLRDFHHFGESLISLHETKLGMMSEIYRILCIHLGEPPTRFDWCFRDKDNKYHAYRDLTPHEFSEVHVPGLIDERICLVHAPTDDKPMNSLLSVRYLGNVVEGHPVRYLNVPIEVIKKAASESIQDGVAVWFGCDVGKRFHRGLGVMDLELYDYDLVLGTDTRLDKAARLDYGDSSMTHAMVFTGVDIEDGKPARWRVENSWGEKVGEKGYFLMTDCWFDEYMYEVVVDRKYVSEEITNIRKQKPIILDPWDPVGALALA